MVLDSDGDVAAPAAAASNSRAVANGKAAANGKADSGSSEVEEVVKAEEGGSAEGAGGAATAVAGGGEADAPALHSFKWDCEDCPICQVELDEAARIAKVRGVCLWVWKRVGECIGCAGLGRGRISLLTLLALQAWASSKAYAAVCISTFPLHAQAFFQQMLWQM